MLYRLLKKVYHSSSVCFSFSSKSYHSGTQSSGFSEDLARAREASFPTKTTSQHHEYHVSLCKRVGAIGDPVCVRAHRELTTVLPRRTVGSVTSDIENGAFDSHQGWAAGIRTYEQQAMFVSRHSRKRRYRGERGTRGCMCIPSHLANSSVEIGSSFGGSSWTGTLGAKRSDMVV